MLSILMIQSTVVLKLPVEKIVSKLVKLMANEPLEIEQLLGQ